MSRHPLTGILVLVAGLVSVTAPLSSIASAAHDRPFKASLVGNANPVFDPESPVVTNHETGVGNANHLGRFVWEDDEVAVFTSMTHAMVSGTFTMTAANGDKLFGSLSTEADVVNGALVISGTFEFTGGTGRFANASGGGTLDGVGALAPPFEITGVFNGTIRY